MGVCLQRIRGEHVRYQVSVIVEVIVSRCELEPSMNSDDISSVFESAICSRKTSLGRWSGFAFAKIVIVNELAELTSGQRRFGCIEQGKHNKALELGQFLVAGSC